MVILRQFVEGQDVFYVLFLGVFLLSVSAIVAFIFGMYAGLKKYSKMKKARAEASKTFSS